MAYQSEYEKYERDIMPRRWYYEKEIKDFVEEFGYEELLKIVPILNN